MGSDRLRREVERIKALAPQRPDPATEARERQFHEHDAPALDRLAALIRRTDYELADAEAVLSERGCDPNLARWIILDSHPEGRDLLDQLGRSVPEFSETLRRVRSHTGGEGIR